MAKCAVAFSPGHISGFFRRIQGKDVEATGSSGAGIVISEGVRAQVRASFRPSVEIRRLSGDGTIVEVRNGSPPLEYAMARLGVTAHVTTECRLPIGAGFGCSAAALLSSITALSRLFHLGLSRTEVAVLAHEAEVVHRTGLGDVAAIQGGGLACRLGAGIAAPITRSVSIHEPIVALSFGPIPTPTVLDSPDRLLQIERACPTRCPVDLQDFFILSRHFTEESGLITPEVATVLTRCDEAGVPASMTMLGNGVVAAGRTAETVLSQFGEPLLLTIAPHGFSEAEVHDHP